MSLRDYQARSFNAARSAIVKYNSVCIQLPTGAGKTPLASEIIKSSYTKGHRVWFVVPRNELLTQGSEHLLKWGVPHGKISAGREESRAYMVHVVSKDTLLRRLDRIKNWPDLLVFDEAHIAIDAQMKIRDAANEYRASLSLPVMKIIGFSATVERLDGRGLSLVYNTCIYGPSIPWLTDRGFLSPLRYFAPPIEGLDKIHRKGTEFDADELEALLEKHKVYGDVINYYRKYGTVSKTAYSLPGQPIIQTNKNYNKGKPALIFCRSVKSAYETAEKFREAGFDFFCIEGNITTAKRKALIDGLKLGRIDGLVNCDICTYGLDVPRVEYGASIRPTLSRALYFQMVGRILRPYEDKQTGYKKEEALFFDHANLIQEHFDPEFPGVPLFKLDSIDWNFYGREKRSRKKADPATLRLCPHLDYQYCDKQSCVGCTLKNPNEDDARRAGLPVIDANLEEREGPKRFSDLMPEEKREVQDRIGRATDEAVKGLMEGGVPSGPIGEMLEVAAEMKWSALWVYWRLTEAENKKRAEAGKSERLTVNVPLLHEIARIRGYKPGKAWYWQKEIQKGMKEKMEAVV